MARPLTIVLFCFSMIAFGQDSIPNKKRMNWVRYGGLTVYSLGMVGLNELWYSQSPRSSFHFFNDAAEWKQVDKVGHLFSSFHISSGTFQALRWAGSNEKKGATISSLAGFIALSSVEIFDGFSPDYGASISDLGANAAGSLLFWGQMIGWGEIRVHPKFSFTRSSMAPLRPKVLGKNLGQEIMKDYNGETFWLSVDMDKFIRFPKWLNLAAGYGASNMKYARDGENKAEGYNPVRQFYFSLDFDFRHIHSRSKFVNGLIFLASMVKLPAPTLEFTNKGMKAYALYF